MHCRGCLAAACFSLLCSLQVSMPMLLTAVFTLALQMVFVVKPVPKAATHAATRLPIVDQIVDMVRGGRLWRLHSTACTQRRSSPSHPVFEPPHPQVSNIVIIKAAIERFTLSGRLRVSLRPLMNQLPLIGSGAQGAAACL